MYLGKDKSVIRENRQRYIYFIDNITYRVWDRYTTTTSRKYEVYNRKLSRAI